MGFISIMFGKTLVRASKKFERLKLCRCEL